MKYEIPVAWQVWGIVEVEADSLKEATEKAKYASMPEGHYIDDSLAIDKESSLYQDLENKEKEK